MKTIGKFATLTLMMLAVSVHGFAATPLNLVRGVGGPVASNVSWSGYSNLALIPGGGLIPITSSTTAFYYGFTAGSEADISNMVLYTTARGSSTITAVTPVTYGGVSNPSIILSNTSVCPVQPLSAGTPCFVRFDPLTLTLSALNDYYLVVYFTPSDANDSAIGATQPQYLNSSLSGWYIGNADETRLTVGQSIPAGNSNHQPYFLMFVMTD
jgi:hypothetical protein